VEFGVFAWSSKCSSADFFSKPKACASTKHLLQPSSPRGEGMPTVSVWSNSGDSEIYETSVDMSGVARVSGARQGTNIG